MYPDNWFLMIWNPLACVVFLWTSIISPFKMAFLTTVPFWWLCIEEVVNIIILIDIILAFRSAYRDEKDVLIDDS